MLEIEEEEQVDVELRVMQYGKEVCIPRVVRVGGQ